LADAAREYARGMQRLNGAVALRQSLIRVETRRGRYDAALRLINDAERIATAKTVWRLQRAEVLRVAGRVEESWRSLNHALVEAERVLARRRSPLNLYQRARVHLGLGDTTAARRDLQAALQTAPRFKKAQTLLGELDTPPAQNPSREEREHVRESTPM
jgi:tetratricopeptide (TPR) repeat protein